ncbi:hypothetical protein Tco_1443764 [Tanacetum coccineum]
MTTLAEHIIVAGAENRPPMLEKSIKTTEDDCVVQATNIILHGLPPDVYALVNHQEAAKDIWDRVNMLMKGTELSYQERECRLYNLFDKMTMQQVQVNTKFLNALPSEWSKFVTDVKLAKSLYTTNNDQLYACLSQHERHTNEVRINREYPIECINKAMEFLSVVASRFPSSNNQLRTSSNPRNQATIQDGRVTVQQVQGRQNQSYAGTGNRGIATTLKGNVVVGPSRVVKCYNCQGEGHMKLRNLVRYSFQTDDLDTYDLDCDDLSSAKAVLMANLSNCDPEVLSEVPYSKSYPNDLINQDVQEMQYSKQTHVDDFDDNEIHRGGNIIPYS